MSEDFIDVTDLNERLRAAASGKRKFTRKDFNDVQELIDSVLVHAIECVDRIDASLRKLSIQHRHTEEQLHARIVDSERRICTYLIQCINEMKKQDGE